MTWTGWIALIASQAAVLWVAAFILIKDAMNALGRWEKAVCCLFCAGLPVLDGLVFAGVIGPGWPPPARTSVELLGFALSVFLLNEAIYQAITPRYFFNARAVVLSRIRLCLYGIALITLAESWLFGAW